jgi:hypothetical protein
MSRQLALKAPSLWRLPESAALRAALAEVCAVWAV